MNVFSELPAVSAVCGVVLAAGTLLLRRRTIANWAFAAGMLVLGAEAVATNLSAHPELTVEQMVRWQDWRLVAASFLPGFWVLFSLSYGRGNAREFLRRWRWLVVAAFILPIGLAAACNDTLVIAVGRGGIAGNWVFPLGPAGIALNFLLLAGSIVVLMNLERTFLASVGTMRWRIKFMLMGIGLLFVVRVFTASQSLIFRLSDLSLENLNAGALIVAALLTLRSFFRAGRNDLDVYPSYSILQGSATVLLAGIYLFAVGGGAQLVVRFGGKNFFALEMVLILVSLALLITLLQSDRLRMRLGRFVSRHFQRPLYDYRTIWRRFTEGTASQADQTELCRSLVKLVADVFQCLSVAIWIVDDHKESLTLAASTFLSADRGRDLALSRTEAGMVTAHFLRHPEPEDIETSQTAHAVLLRRAHPSEFPQKENRVCLPMIARGEVIALLVLGDHIGGAAFSAQDFDMLKCVGDHATASLLNVQLAHKLLQAKEMEAFQTMAAFFVHDLKNAASTLSIMLKNMPVHFENPAFREDALRGIAKSVDHINHVISRLSLLDRGLKILPAEADLNDVVASVLAGIESGPDFSIRKELGRLPKITFDREQLSKVAINLVLNAKEAMEGRGEIDLSTTQENGWVVLKVRDRGCGMSADFIERSLFRPFQTTKKNGLGIGMFQSKMIVEAHGGRIGVASQPGAGTTFEVFLPARKKAE